MSEDTYVSFGSLRTGALLSYRPNSEILIKISEDTVALLRDVEGGAHVRFLQGNSHTSVFPRQVHAAEQEPVRWSNGCNQSVPRALRYLANHDRPIGGSSQFNGEHLLQLADEIERMASMQLYNAPPLPADTVKKFKFDTLVEHCKRQDKEIAGMRAELNDLRIYTAGAAWHWQGDGQDFLESLTCPVVINAEDLRELLKLAVAAAAPVEGKAAVVLGDDLYVHSVKSVLRLNDDGLWANFELNGKHVAINLDYVGPAKAFCAEFRAEYAPKPKCDGNHGGPRCADPECWNDDQPGVVVRSGVINFVSDFSEVDSLLPTNEPDWNQAPDGATHVGSKHSPGIVCWFREVSEGVFDFWYQTKGVMDVDGWKRMGRTSYHAPLIARPAAVKAPDWNGEGLPPVGTVCKIVDEGGSLIYGHGESGPVVAHVENCAVVRMSYGLGCFEGGYLRPVRTPEQIAAEECEAAVSAMWTQLNLRLPERHRIFDGKYRDALFSVLATLHKVGYQLPGGEK